MITVKIDIDKERRECSLCVKGHAGYAGIGQDIVCASVSILAYTAVQCLCDTEDKAPKFSMGKGECFIPPQAVKTSFEEAVQTLSVMRQGYTLLAHNYPQHVELITDVSA